MYSFAPSWVPPAVRPLSLCSSVFSLLALFVTQTIRKLFWKSGSEAPASPNAIGLPYSGLMSFWKSMPSFCSWAISAALPKLARGSRCSSCFSCAAAAALGLVAIVITNGVCAGKYDSEVPSGSGEDPLELDPHPARTAPAASDSEQQEQEATHRRQAYPGARPAGRRTLLRSS